MRTVIVIPARLAATRLPGKPLRLLGQVPLVVRVARQALRCPGSPEVVVASDAPQVLDAARSYGLQAVATGNHASGTDRVAEVVRDRDVDCVVNLQGDEPFIAPADLARLITAVQQPHTDMATLAHPLTRTADLHDPSVVKVVCRDDGSALYFSRAAIPHDRHGDAATALCMGHIGVYAFRRAALLALSTTPPHPLEMHEGLEQLRALAAGKVIRVLRARHPALGIDTEADLARAQDHVARLGEAAFDAPCQEMP